MIELYHYLMMKGLVPMRQRVPYKKGNAQEKHDFLSTDEFSSCVTRYL